MYWVGFKSAYGVRTTHKDKCKQVCSIKFYNGDDDGDDVNVFFVCQQAARLAQGSMVDLTAASGFEASNGEADGMSIAGWVMLLRGDVALPVPVAKMIAKRQLSA
eukprot:8168879-Heterocapsa_arctica.AAC.1